jgi:DNA-binding transcriptional MerR regulator
MGRKGINSPEWGTSKFCELAGIKPRQIRYWIEKGLLRKRTATPTGRGHYLRFDLRDLIAVMTIVKLKKLGISTYRIRTSILRMHELFNVDNPLAELKVINFASTIAFKKNGRYYDGINGQILFQYISETIISNGGPDTIEIFSKEIESADEVIAKLIVGS